MWRVANGLDNAGHGHLNVANGFISKNFKIMMFLDKFGISKLIYTCSATKHICMRKQGPGYKNCMLKQLDLSSHITPLLVGTVGILL